jgi:cytochrome d ubiquinol oxidase subunit II
MTLAETLLGLTWIGLTAYALFAGADFGGGFWDLLAGGAKRGAAQRALIEHVIAPIWEANHVWLIFVLVVLWTAFPTVFAAVASTLYIPMTGAAVGIILRGCGFAFRKAVDKLALERLFGVAFAASSVLTPFFLGAMAGGVASGRVPPGNAAGDPWRSWLNPTSLLGGSLAVIVCAYLAAVYLTWDAEREGKPALAETFRRRGLGAGIAAGAIALGGIVVLRADAPALFVGLTGRALPLIAVSAVGGIASLGLLMTRHYAAARAAAAAAVTAIVWGWAAGQYPYMLSGAVTIAEAAASEATLTAMFASLLVGAVLVIPSLVWLYVLFQRTEPTEPVQAPDEQPREITPQQGRDALRERTAPPGSAPEGPTR